MITGNGQSVENVKKVSNMAEKLKHFFIQTKLLKVTNKYKLKKKNLMLSIEDKVLLMTPTLSRMRSIAKWWSKIPPNVAHSLKAIVAASTIMMASDKATWLMRWDILSIKETKRRGTRMMIHHRKLQET